MSLDYERIITAPKEEEASKPISLVQTALLTNSIAMRVQYPHLYGSEVDTTFNPADTKYDEFFSALNDDEKIAIQGAHSEENMYNKLARHHIYQEASKEFAQDDSYLKYGKMLMTGAVDPINFIPVAGAVGKVSSAVKATTTLGRMGAVGLGTAGIGAVSNVASEALFDAQGLPTDYQSAAIFGAVLGGIIGGGIEGITRASFKSKVEATVNDYMTNKADKAYIEGIKFTEDAPVGTTLKPLAPTVTHTPADIPKMGGPMSWTPNWLKSDIAIAYGSKDGAVRDIISRMDRSSVDTGATQYGNASSRIKEMDGSVHKAQVDMQMAYRDAIVDGKKFTGTLDDWYDDVGMRYNKRANDQEQLVKNDEGYKLEKEKFKKDIEAVNKKLKETKDKESIKAFKEQQDQINTKWRATQDTYFAKYKPTDLTPAEKAMHTYYDTMRQRGAEAGIEIFANSPANKMYNPRSLNLAKVKAMSDNELYDSFKRAVEGDAGNAKLSIEAKDKLIQQLVKNARDSVVNSDFKDLTVFAARSGLDKATSMHARRLQLNTAAAPEIFSTNAMENMGKYHYWTRGNIAVRESFPELRQSDIVDDNIFKAFDEQVVSKIGKDVTPRERQALNNVLSDIMGTRRIVQNANGPIWSSTRIATQANSLLMGGMFGAIQLLEIPSALWATGFNRIWHSQYADMFVEVTKALHTGEMKGFVKDLAVLGNMTSILQTHGINKMADTDTVFHMGRAETILQHGNEKLFKWNGMKAITSWMEGIVASNTITKLLDMNTDALTKSDNYYLRMWGVNKKQLKGIQQQLNEVSNIKNGYVHSLNLDDMADDVLEDLSRALNMSIKMGVMEGDSKHLPSWFIDLTKNPAGRLFSQFLRFPIMANELLLQRGMNDDLAGWTATSIASVAMAMGMFKLVEEAEIATGAKDKHKAQFDMSTEEGINNLTTKALQYVAPFGALTVAKDIIGTLVGSDTGSGYSRTGRGVGIDALGPSASQFNKLIKASQFYANGDTTAGNEQLIYSGVPNIPIAGRLFRDSLIELNRGY